MRGRFLFVTREVREMSTTVATTNSRPARAWSVLERERLADLGFIPNASDAELRFTFTQCEQLETNGFLIGERYELIHGEIVTMPPPNEPHTCCISLVFAALQFVFSAGYYVRNQGSLLVSDGTCVVPDIAVVLGNPREYSTRPSTALLVVEVSDSSYVFDITVKAELYATAGIAEYWIVDLNARRLVVLRDPAPLPDGGVANRTHLFRYTNESISPLAMPTATVAVNDLLP
jgi:Uma2 family endonuclease